jgi:hypothetical protein
LALASTHKRRSKKVIVIYRLHSKDVPKSFTSDFGHALQTSHNAIERSFGTQVWTPEPLTSLSVIVRNQLGSKCWPQVELVVEELTRQTRFCVKQSVAWYHFEHSSCAVALG